ncbi:hypothetical protein [Actinoplanes sp. NPDC051859]|uniref:hypothetical protein n=1 Tax=Actinoplanes sp. NPDC051859 TaxID=3363909 RepID=UPI0037BB0474
MGHTRSEREEPLPRARYVAAARRYLDAFSVVLASGVPIDPGPPGAVRNWTARDVAALREFQAALGDLLDTRRS